MQVFSKIQRVFSWLSRPEKYRNLFARKGEKIPTSMLLFSTLTQRERVNHLPHLTPEKAGQLYEAYLRGELAEVQMVWKQMEDFDSTLGTVLHARQSALAEMTWRIETDDDLTADSDELAALAAKQKAYLNAVLRGVDNLEEALVHLGMADFRGVAAVELTGDRQRQVWSVIEPWNLTKPVLHGPWLYNAMADTVCTHPEELDEERVIIREARALDLAAMFLVLSKVHALQGWDGFLDIYGLPSVFAELPASIPEDQALEFDLVVKRMVGDGRGTVPNGTKFQTVETTKDNAQAFEQRAKWCDEAIIKLGLGGLLTVETQAGSGTLAGNAHADSFERLCAASARSISRAVDTQYCRRMLRAKFGPHTPILVHFVFGPQETEDRAAIATMLATLATAGYRAEDTVASDLLGIEITSANMDSTAIYAARAAGYVPTQAAMQQRMGMPLKPAPAAEGSGVASPPMVANRAAAEGSRLRAEGATPRQAGVASRAPEPQPDSAPLSAEELEAINALANGGLNQEQIAQDAATAANALAEAVQGDGKVVANTEDELLENRKKRNSTHCRNHEQGKPCSIHDDLDNDLSIPGDGKGKKRSAPSNHKKHAKQAEKRKAAGNKRNTEINAFIGANKGKRFRNENIGLSANITADLAGEIIHNARTSVYGLKDLGLSGEEIMDMHFAQAQRIETLFANAELKAKPKIDKSHDKPGRTKERLWVFTAPVDNEKGLPIEARITVCKFKERKEPHPKLGNSSLSHRRL